MSTSKAQNLVGDLARVGQEAPLAEVAALLGELEALKAVLWQRLLAAGVAAATPPRDATDDLRHLTPAQVAELLSLKEPYVHELCRTGRLPAVKHGKYWLIPHAALRERLAYRPGDIDAGSARPVGSVPLRGDIARGPGGRPRRSPTFS
ncbi:MAG TPA: helix-turn-helix domain-containing protein [Candidatus Limnocylindria bacterium]|nr:helix-turn-helix domain-containing protein [Candidatus Limnocylindria bacterium]